MGKKPLYYYCSGASLRFSSELFSLAQDSSVPGNLWDQALFEYPLVRLCARAAHDFSRCVQTPRGPHGCFRFGRPSYSAILEATSS